MRPVFQRVAGILNRMYPLRLKALYMVGLPMPLRWALRAIMHFLHAETRKKMRICQRPDDVPHALPSLLHSHKLTGGMGLDAVSYESETGDVWSEAPMTPLHTRTPRRAWRSNTKSRPKWMLATYGGVVLLALLLAYVVLLQQLMPETSRQVAAQMASVFHVQSLQVPLAFAAPIVGLSRR